MNISSLICGLLLGLAGSAQVLAQASPEAALDALHKAGADANPTVFTALLAEDVVFLGMDAANRLEGQAVRNFVTDSFAKGNAWTFRSGQRETRLSNDGTVAWFDESLAHDQLGHGRGTGVLIRMGEGWKVAQYNLTVPLPNAAVATSGSGGAQAVIPAGTATNPAPAIAPATQEKKRCMMTSFKTNTRADC